MAKILIVEDEAKMRVALERVFSQEGFKVTTASNGQTALEKLDVDKPDIILLDLLMPIMNGLDTLKKLKQDRSTQDIPVILLTNLEPDRVLLKELETNSPAFYLIKSNVDLDDVVVKVNDVLNPDEFKIN